MAMIINEETVRAIIFDELYIGNLERVYYPSDLKREHSLRDDLGADSLDELELMLRFEDEFDYDITYTEAKKMKTVGDILDYAKIHFYGQCIPRHIL